MLKKNNKENKNRFTIVSKTAEHTVPEHFKYMLNSLNTSLLLKKRTNFVCDSKKWKHQEGGIMQAAAGLIPIYGTYLDYEQFEDNPSWGNFGNLVLSGVGDVLQLTGLGYGLGSAIKGLKAANTTRKSIKALQATREATRLANLKKMLEKSKAGTRAYQGWIQSGKNLRRVNLKLDKVNQERNKTIKLLGLGLIEPSIEGFLIYNNFKN